MERSYMSSFTYILLNIFIQLLHLTSSSSSIPQNSTTSLNRYCHQDQSDALLHIKTTLYTGYPDRLCDNDGLPYTNLKSWKEGTNCCTWDGVTCNKVSGHIVKLDLSCSGLQGPIQSNSSLYKLSHLQSLNLASNNLSVFQMPSKFGKELKYLNLSNTIVAGYVPLEVANLSKLETLVISPYEFGLGQSNITNFDTLLQQLTKLQILILNSINFDGYHLKGIANLTKLRRLDLRYCDLEGDLLSVDFSNLQHLEKLDLDENRFGGGFPISLSNLSKLSYLSISKNRLTGNIPLITHGFEALSTMILDSNSLEGHIPNWVFNRTSLQTIDIHQNLLVGSLPSNITWPHKLLYLDLSANALTGNIPSAWFSLPSVVFFSLENNELTGYVGEFQSLMLQDINLSGNSLEGGNFSSISKLVSLRSLDVAYNNLAGTFELDVFANLNNLESVDLQKNIFLSLNSRNNTPYSPLPNLNRFVMSNCNANEIPFFVRNLVAMMTLFLDGNNIQGLLPEWLHNISITTFVLDDNSITGGIHNLPLGSDVSLSYNKLRALPSSVSGGPTIDLSHNFIERGLENLPWINTDSLDLSFNKLVGEIKGNISMTSLKLSHNYLT